MVLYRYSSGFNIEIVLLARVINDVEPNVSVVCSIGWIHALVEAFTSFMGSGYR